MSSTTTSGCLTPRRIRAKRLIRRRLAMAGRPADAVNPHCEICADWIVNGQAGAVCGGRGGTAEPPCWQLVADRNGDCDPLTGDLFEDAPPAAEALTRNQSGREARGCPASPGGPSPADDRFGAAERTLPSRAAATDAARHPEAVAGGVSCDLLCPAGPPVAAPPADCRQDDNSPPMGAPQPRVGSTGRGPERPAAVCAPVAGTSAATAGESAGRLAGSRQAMTASPNVPAGLPRPAGAVGRPEGLSNPAAASLPPPAIAVPPHGATGPQADRAGDGRVSPRPPAPATYRESICGPCG